MKMFLVAFATCLLLSVPPTLALDNGVARVPPMGFSSWLTMKFNVSADKLMRWADGIVSAGLRDGLSLSSASYNSRFLVRDVVPTSPNRFFTTYSSSLYTGGLGRKSIVLWNSVVH